MYTQLIAIAEIKQEFHEKLQKIFNQEDNDSWEILGIESESFKEFLNCDRYTCIPFMEYPYHLTPQFNNGNIVIWCNLKNYNSEIEKFFEVLKEISHEIHCFKSKHEESDCWRDYLK